ncbi:MAG: cytoplasmic protein [Desulfobacterales bacterium]|nr:cytoplasmic protein [Desulfobacterales bacterium]
MSEENKIDFTVDKENFYREEGFTDLKVASIRRLTPVTSEGEVDKGRLPIFIGVTQVMTSEGPVPIQAALKARTLAQAIEGFPAAMEKATREAIEDMKKRQAG